MLRTDRDRLRTLLQQHSLKFGDFTLTSGKKSRFYFDSKQTTLRPEGAYLTAAEILSVLRENGVKARAVGGMTLGADPIVCPMAALSHLDGEPMSAFIVRKEAKGHGAGNRIEGLPERGTPVVIIDDVVTTAGSTLRSIEAAEEAGLEVVAVVCLVDREEGGTEKLARWPFFPIFRRSEIFDEAAAKSPKNS